MFLWWSKRASDPLQLEFLGVRSDFCTQMPWMKLRSSARNICVLYPKPTLQNLFFFYTHTFTTNISLKISMALPIVLYTFFFLYSFIVECRELMYHTLKFYTNRKRTVYLYEILKYLRSSYTYNTIFLHRFCGIRLKWYSEDLIT